MSKDILILAKQGEPKAIAALMNRYLQKEGITAKAAIKDGCLKILLESINKEPDKQKMVEFIRKGMDNLGVESIHRVIVYGKKSGENSQWSHEIELFKNPFSSIQEPQEKTQEKTQENVVVVNSISSRKITLGILAAVAVIFVVYNVGSNIIANNSLDKTSQEFQDLNDEFNSNMNKLADSVIVLQASSCKNPSSSISPQGCKNISKSEMGDKWAFTVQDGTLVCRNNALFFVTFSEDKSDDKVYPVDSKKLDSIKLHKPAFSWFPWFTQKASIQPIQDMRSLVCSNPSSLKDSK